MDRENQFIQVPKGETKDFRRKTSRRIKKIEPSE